MIALTAAMLQGNTSPDADVREASEPAEEGRGPMLNWVRLPGAERCVGPVALALRVEEHLGRSVFVRASQALLVVEGRVARGAQGEFSAVIRITHPDGRVYGMRELAVPAAVDCGPLGDMVALVIAITLRGQAGPAGIPLPPDIAAMLDALFAEESGELDPEALPDGPPLPAGSDRVPAAAREPEPEPASGGGERRSHGLRLAAGAELFTALGLQPGATFGAGIHGRLSFFQAFDVVLSGRLALPQTRAAPGSAGEITYGVWQLGLAACLPETSLPIGALTMCTTAALNHLMTRAGGFASRNDRTGELFPQMGVEGRARMVLAGPVQAHLRLGVPLRFSRPAIRYVAGDGTTVEHFRVTQFGVEGAFGFEVVLW